MKRAGVKKKQKMVGESSSMDNLPSHILIEIISRLPIKTLMVIRCVSKSLLSLVSDYNFQMLYSTTAPTELLVSATRESSKTLSVAEFVFQDDSVTYVDTESNFVFELPRSSVGWSNNFNAIVSLVNSCCGLVCFRGPIGNKFVVICNPFTREYVTLPCPTLHRKYVCYGLGFSRKDNKFKLLRLICYANGSRMVGQVYTFGERGSWKRVANLPDEYPSQAAQDKVIFHEGALHWYCPSPGGSMITFDFDTELFGKLGTPLRIDIFPCGILGVFDNCLCISGCVGSRVDIWALKEYGQGPWIKIFSIQKGSSWSKSYEPFKYLQNDGVSMFKISGGMACFNPDTRSLKKVGGISYRNVAVFVRPSLVSLKVLLGDEVEVRSVKPWDPMKAATRSYYHGCMAGSSAPRSSSKASTSTSHPTEENVEEGVVPAISDSQQGGNTDNGNFGIQDQRPPEDRCGCQCFSVTQKLVDEIESLKVENEQQGKAIAKLKKRKKKDQAFTRLVYQQMLNMSRNMPDCPIPDDSSSSDDSD